MKRKKGFTLVELAVTLVVVLILMSISIPLYQANTTKFKMAEGYALLASIRSAQEQYYAEYGNFLFSDQASAGSPASANTRYTCNAEVLGINAITNQYFTLFCVNGAGTDQFTKGTVYPASDNNMKYKFLAWVKSSKLGTLQMTYNVTMGVKITKDTI